MLNLPKSTEIRKFIFKKLIYTKFKDEMTSAKRSEFDQDISKIILVNEISSKTLNIEADENAKPIFVVNIQVKHKDFNEKNIITIAKLFQQKLVLIVQYQNEAKLCIYQNKLFSLPWQAVDELNIKIQGLNLNTIWENFVIQIGKINLQAQNTLDEQIQQDDQRAKLLAKIEQLTKKMTKEKQPRKKFALKQELNTLKSQLK